MLYSRENIFELFFSIDSLLLIGLYFLGIFLYNYRHVPHCLYFFSNTVLFFVFTCLRSVDQGAIVGNIAFNTTAIINYFCKYYMILYYVGFHYSFIGLSPWRASKI